MKFRHAIAAYHLFIGTLLTLPTAVFAQTVPAAPAAGTAGAAGISGTGSTACNALVNSQAVANANGMLTGLIVILSGTPFKVAAVLGSLICAVGLFLDSGHFGQHIKQFLMVIIIIMLVGLFVGWAFGGSLNIASC